MGLDLGRHRLTLLLPGLEPACTMAACTSASDAGLHNGSEVHAAVTPAEEVSVEVESPFENRCRCGCFSPPNNWWRFDWIDSRAERIRERTGCGNCRIAAHEEDAREWGAVHFCGVPAAVDQAL